MKNISESVKRTLIVLTIFLCFALVSCQNLLGPTQVDLSSNDLAVFNATPFDVNCLIDGTQYAIPHGQYTTIVWKKSFQSLSVLSTKVAPSSSGILPANIAILGCINSLDSPGEYLWNISGYTLDIKATGGNNVSNYSLNPMQYVSGPSLSNVSWNYSGYVKNVECTDVWGMTYFINK